MSDGRWALTTEARERLKAGAEAIGGQAALARAVGMPKGTINKIITGDGDVGAARLLEMAKAIGVSVDYILTGEGGPTSDASSDEMIGIPMLGVTLSAGPGAWAEVDAGHQSDWMFPREWILKSFGSEKHLRLMRVVGDSMLPDLEDGEWVMLNVNRREGDGVFALQLDTDILVKRVQREGRYVRLISSNKDAYEPIIIDQEDQGRTLKIIGRVVWNSRLPRG